MNTLSSLRIKAACALAGLSLLLSGCFITPGKFTSELELAQNDTFTFTYEGEIFFLGLSKLAEMGAGADAFEPSECYDEETYETRECTQAELDEQRAEWDAGAEARAAEEKQKAEQMAQVMGGIDPSDPEATANLTRLLLRQKGWNRVEDKGDGVFDVSYQVSGTLSHDFMFPVIEDFPTTNPFVQVFLRDGRVARINAPGFTAENETNPFGSMMGGMAGLAGMAAMSESAPGKSAPDFPTIEGTFSIKTTGDMQILANNTDEGPSATPTGQILTWEISPRTKAAPTALIDMSS